ncbi:phage baseplate protein [Serratia proteamaculans]
MDILSTLFSQQSRKIGLIIPSVVITEKHSDSLEITEHPVEDKAPVADHAFRRPSELMMEVGFAGGGSLLDFVDTSSVGLGIGLSPSETYDELLVLQRSRVPFDVTTGKRIYKNMLIRVLDVTTDRASENVLMATLTLREVLITATQSANVADKKDMAQGVSTSGVQNSGTKSVKTVNESILSKGASILMGQ